MSGNTKYLISIAQGQKIVIFNSWETKNIDFYCFVTENLKQITSVTSKRLSLTINIFKNPRILSKICMDILLGIDKLHINGVEHGDLRLNNIGIRNNDFVIFDFNASKINSKNLGKQDAIIFLNDHNYYDKRNIIKFTTSFSVAILPNGTLFE